MHPENDTAILQSSAEAWAPEELATDTSWQVTLTDHDRTELRSALFHYRKLCEAQQSPLAVPLEASLFPLPGMAQLLARIQHDLEYGKGVFLLQDFPLDCSEEDAKVMYGGLLSHIGWLKAQTIYGEYLQPVQDEGQARLDERRGSKHNLGLPIHNDGCDVVAFLCRRPAQRGGETILVSPAAVHNQMLQDHPDALRQLYGHYHNAWQDYMYPEGRNSDQSKRSRTWEAPIFSMAEGRICARYSRFYIDRAQSYPGVPGMSEAQLNALNVFDEYIYGADRWQFRRQFRKGDVLLLNNHIVFHSRTAFEDGAEVASKRQLYRAWMAMPNSRPLSPALHDFFGNVTAGSAGRCCVKHEFMIPTAAN